MSSGHDHKSSKQAEQEAGDQADTKSTSSTGKDNEGHELATEQEAQDDQSPRDERQPSPDVDQSHENNEGQEQPDDGGQDHLEESDHEDANMAEDEVDPENFDSKSFLSSVSDLSVKLQDDKLRHVDNDFPASDLKQMVHSVTSVMNQFKGYAMHSQQQLEAVREQMKDIKDRVYKRIQAKGYDPKSVHEKKSYEERELDAKLAQLNKELAKVSEELLRASQLSLDTETAAVEASAVAERAAEEARQIQIEYESRRKAEAEARKAEEQRREAQRKRHEEEERRNEEVRKSEEARSTRLRKPDENKVAEWESWPSFTYNVDANEYNQGIGCIIRGDPSNFRENMVAVCVLNPLDTESLLAENEELVGDVIDLKPAHGDETIQKTIYVAMPHFTSRASAISREPVIKSEVKDGKWEELKCQEVTFDGYKDLKFVQAEVKSFSRCCVVTRYKRNFLHFSKKGGKTPSTVDPRVTFTAEKGAFKKPENFIVQLQPVDSATISRVKERTEDGKSLLTSSAVVNMEWTSGSFDNPVTMTLPCPPNPVKAKKAAAARAAKEAKMKNPAPPPSYGDDEPRRRDKKKNTKQRSTGDDDDGRPKSAVRFYMGQYGDNEDDENDALFFLKRMPNGKWMTLEYMSIVQVKLDLLQLRLTEPIDRFMVLRTKTSVDAKMAQMLAETIEVCLKERVVGVILRQKLDNPCDVLLNVVAAGKVDKILKSLEDEGYETENSNTTSSKEVSMRVLNEGDTLEIDFRGNIKAQNTDKAMQFSFNSQLQSQIHFSIIEVNKYLQRGFNDFRGYVKLVKSTRIVHMPTKKEESEGETEPRIEIKRDLISEHMVKIPKEEENTQMIVKAPVVIKNESHCLDDETLHHISQSLGDEWTRVAHQLNVRRQRIQAILRNNPVGEEEDVKFDMLLTWLKKVPRSQNKVDILVSALTSSNRPDLADELRTIEREFQAQRKGGNNHVVAEDRRSVRSGSARSVRDEE